MLFNKRVAQESGMFTLRLKFLLECYFLNRVINRAYLVIIQELKYLKIYLENCLRTSICLYFLAFTYKLSFSQKAPVPLIMNSDLHLL